MLEVISWGESEFHRISDSRFGADAGENESDEASTGTMPSGWFLSGKRDVTVVALS
jgi:hypothetical protein